MSFEESGADFEDAVEGLARAVFNTPDQTLDQLVHELGKVLGIGDQLVYCHIRMVPHTLVTFAIDAGNEVFLDLILDKLLPDYEVCNFADHPEGATPRKNWAGWVIYRVEGDRQVVLQKLKIVLDRFEVEAHQEDAQLFLEVVRRSQKLCDLGLQQLPQMLRVVADQAGET